MKNTGNKRIEVPILNNEYSVIVCWGSKPFIRGLLKKEGHEFTEDELDWTKFRGRFFGTPLKLGVIVLPRKPKTSYDVGTLAHEAVHAVEDIFEQIDERSHDEVFAHSVGAIVREALQ